MSSIHSGKSVEYIIAGQLLAMGLDVYMPLVDKGIDLIIRYDDNQFIELQIKSRNEDSISNRRFNLSNTKVPCFHIFCTTTFDNQFLQIKHMWIFDPEQLDLFPAKGMTALSENKSTKYGQFYANDLSRFSTENMQEWFEQKLLFNEKKI